jgi:hypothetical protein
MSESPLKVALITIKPTDSDVVVSSALPLLRLTVPRTVFPAVKVTGHRVWFRRRWPKR